MFLLFAVFAGEAIPRTEEKVRFDGGLTVPGDRVLFMLSVTVGEGLLQVSRERKRLLVQYFTARGMYDERWRTV